MQKRTEKTINKLVEPIKPVEIEQMVQVISIVGFGIILSCVFLMLEIIIKIFLCQAKQKKISINN